MPQSSESQPFPLPILPCPDIPIGGRLSHFVEQSGELTNNKWVLSIVRDGFRLPFKSTLPLSSVPISLESVFLPTTGTRDHGSSSETGSGKGTRSGNSRPLFPAISCTKKEQKVTPGNRSFAVKSIYKETTMETVKSIRQSILVHDWTVSIDWTNAYLHVPIHPLSRKYLRFMFKRSGLSVHVLTFQNGPKSMDFHQTDGRYSIAHAPTCHPCISIPR